MKKLLTATILLLPVYLVSFASVIAGPSSTNYELQEYSFGSAGTGTGFSSTNFQMLGTLGETEFGQLSSANYKSGTGLNYLLQSGVPPAPTLSNNDATYYDKLKLSINYSSIYGSVPSDIQFAIAVSTDFSNPGLTQYVQSDQTLGTSPVWQTYSAWGGASGFNILGLTSNTIYYAKVAARQGQFTQSGFGPANSPGVPTAAPVTLSYSVRTVNQSSPPFSVSLGDLTPGSVVASSDYGRVTIDTNSNSGALVYIYSSNGGLQSSSQGNYLIQSVSGSGQDLTAIGQGYGVRATSVSQTSGNLVISEPYDGTGSLVGPVDTSQRILFTTDEQPITAGVGEFEIQAKASINAPVAADYTDTLTIIVAGTF